MDKHVIPAAPGIRLRIETQKEQEKPSRLLLEIVGWSQSENDDGRSVLLPIVWGYRSGDTGQAESLEAVIADITSDGMTVTGIKMVTATSSR